MRSLECSMFQCLSCSRRRNDLEQLRAHAVDVYLLPAVSGMNAGSPFPSASINNVHPPLPHQIRILLSSFLDLLELRLQPANCFTIRQNSLSFSRGDIACTEDSNEVAAVKDSWIQVASRRCFDRDRGWCSMLCLTYHWTCGRR